MTRVIEGWIRENPGQWLWTHRRWRPATLPKLRRTQLAPVLGPTAPGRCGGGSSDRDDGEWPGDGILIR